MTQIDIKLSAIYQAAHDELPTRASDFAGRASSISSAIDPVVAQLALAGNHPIGGEMLALADELFFHLRRMTSIFNDSATALDRIADDFVELEGGVAEHWRSQHQQYLGEPDLPSLPSAPSPAPVLGTPS